MERTVYAQQHILEHLRVNIPVFWQRFFDARQFRLLLVVRNANTAHPPGFAPFADSSVIDVTAERQRAHKRPDLLHCGFQLVFVGFADALLFHPSTFCPNRKNPARLVLSSPRAQVNLLRHASRDDPLVRTPVKIPRRLIPGPARLTRCRRPFLLAGGDTAPPMRRSARMLSDERARYNLIVAGILDVPSARRTLCCRTPN